jgi:DNA mismatch repair ATPase MutS
MDAVEQLDVLVSLATYAFNNPENVYAELSEEHQFVELRDVKHPLINAQVVGNGFRIGKPERFYLLTGANMTGKSTYIRTIGVSVLLSYVGLPIKASKAVVPVLHLYTSMRITDSLQDDRSYFKAELNRMQHIMQQAATGQPALILIDEPLKGTNSLDKRNGTIAIIRRLLERNTVGIIATHDTQLCDMEVLHAPLLVNRHFDSEVVDGELVFDYTLKNGCSQSNNATILMEKMGII